QQLAAGGVSKGATVHTPDGLTYVWPDADVDQPDNIVAGGQVIPLSAPTGATRIGLLGSGTNCNPGSSGNVVLTYTDRTSQTVHVGLSDWTLGAGGFPPAFGNTTAVSTDYRNGTSGNNQMVKTFIFSAATSLQAGKTLASITLPATVDQGQFHVFS